jgi:DNA invertase Pin-like site-specific DNA recombinase
MELSAFSSPRRAYSYSRVSSGQQVAGGGLDRQEAMAQEWCACHGCELDTALDLTDAGRSAYRGDHIRTGALGRFLEQAQGRLLGPSPVLLIEAVDRLSRQEPLEALSDTFLALVRAGVAVVDLEDGQTYSRNSLNTDPLALVKLALKVQAAHDYSRRLSRRVSAHWEQARERGRAGQLMRGVGGPLPFWLEPNPDGGWQLIEKRAEAVRLIFQLVLDHGMGSIASELNRLGLPGPTGGLWRSTSVALVLKSPAAWGARAMNHRSVERAKARRKQWELNASGPPPEMPVIELVPGYFPAVVSLEEFDHAARAVDRRRNTSTAKARADGPMHTWLQGLIFCGGGSLMVACTHLAKGHTVAVLRCRAQRDGRGCSCKRSGWKAAYLEAHVLQRLPQLMQALTSHQLAGHADEAQKLELQVQSARDNISSARASLRKAEKSRDEAVDDSSSVALLEQMAELVEKRQCVVRAAEKRLAEAQSRVDDCCRRQSLSADFLGDEANEVMRALLAGSSTTEQRREFNALLRQVGFGVLLDDSDSARRQVRVQLGKMVLPGWTFLGEDEIPLALSSWEHTLPA